MAFKVSIILLSRIIKTQDCKYLRYGLKLKAFLFLFLKRRRRHREARVGQINQNPFQLRKRKTKTFGPTFPPSYTEVRARMVSGSTCEN